MCCCTFFLSCVLCGSSALFFLVVGAGAGSLLNVDPALPNQAPVVSVRVEAFAPSPILSRSPHAVARAFRVTLRLGAGRSTWLEDDSDVEPSDSDDSEGLCGTCPSETV
jgi:hypothetical protein